MPFKKGYRHSEETKKKLSKAKKLNPTRYWLGKKHSEKTKKNISAAQKKRYANGAVTWIKGKKHSEKTLKKLAKTWFKKGQQPLNKGKKHSEKAKRNMSEAQKKRFANGAVTWNKGKTGIYSEEHLKKMSESRKKLFASGFIHPMTGKKQNEKTKKAIRLANLGRKASAATKKKMSESNQKLYASGYQSPNKGRKHTKESLEKISLASLGHPVSDKTRKKISLTNTGKKRSAATKKKMSESRKKIYAGPKGNEVRKNQSEAQKKLFASGYIHPRLGYKNTEEELKKMSERTTKLYASGKYFPRLGVKASPELRKKLSEVHSTPELIAFARKQRLHQVFPVKDSIIEIILQKGLQKKGIKFEKHKPILGQPDVFIEPNVCIFADGDYWHGWLYLQGKDCSQRKVFNNEYFDKKILYDKEITQNLKKNGYKVLRFWEHEIHKDPEKCLQKIIKAIKESN